MQFGPGGFRTVAQDSDDDIVGCCAAVLSYPTGSRPERPDFGVTEQAFHENGPNVVEIRSALAAWEPRAHTTIEVTDLDLMTLTAKVRVQSEAPAS